MQFKSMTDVLIFIQRNLHAIRTASTTNGHAATLNTMIENYLGAQRKYALSDWQAATDAYSASRGKRSA